MKKIILCALAATTLLFAACNKEKDNESNNNNVVAEAADNELIIDGTIYHMEGGFGAMNNSMGIYEAASKEKNAAEEPLLVLEGFHIYHEIANQDIDLTQIFDHWPGYNFMLLGEKEWIFGSHVVNEERYIGGHIEGDTYDNTPAFKYGTLRADVSNGTMTLTVKGETKNGHKINMKLVSPNCGWEN